MTLLVSWIAVDTHGPSSIYICADSRLAWSGLGHYDHGRKVFACRHSADIFGYCGDVLFPSMALGQIVEMADTGLLFEPDASPNERSKRVIQKLRYQFSSYPSHVAGITASALEVIHASRDHEGRGFECRLLRWTKPGGWSVDEVKLPNHSDVLFVRGSGASDFKKRFQEYRSGPNARTSRSAFHCFCDSLQNSGVSSVGGAPQLAGIIRKPRSTGIQYGVIASGRRFLLGSRVDELSNFDRMEWRNELFEVCDGRTGNRNPISQPQPNPHLQ